MTYKVTLRNTLHLQPNLRLWVQKLRRHIVDPLSFYHGPLFETNCFTM